MNEFTEQLNSADGQAWLAMQYVLAELPEDQRVAFEDAMAVDAGLCEVVVDACRLSAGVVLACESDRVDVRPVMLPHVRVRSWKTLHIRFGVLAACASLLAVLIVVSSLDREQVSGTVVSAHDDDAGTAEALVALLQDQFSSGADAEVEGETVVDDSLADLMAPEWLLTAVDLDEMATPGDDDDLPDDSNLF